MHEINLDVLTSELMAINCLTNGPSWAITATKERRFHDICDIVEQCDKDRGAEMAIRHYSTKAAEAATPDMATPDMQHIDRREKAFARTISEVHRHAMRVSPVQMAQSLRDALSTQLLAYITGQSERTVQRWAKGDVADIRQDSKRRLVTAYEILQIINRFEAPGVAQTWFIGIEPQLDFVMPAKAVREDRLEEALAAARSFVAVG